MVQSGDIYHKGNVVAVANNSVQVKIYSASSCSGCHLKGACTSADVQEKYIDVTVEKGANYQLGEEVWVSCSNQQGFYALFWAYILPLILVLVALFTTYTLNQNELYAGGMSLAILPPYYIFLFIKKKYFKRQLNIKIKK